MNPIRVLICYSSGVARRFLEDVLEASSDIEIVGVAATSALAIQQISQVVPDLLLLDVELPETDSVEVVAQIRSCWPRLRVIACGSLTEAGARATLRAIAAGATDYFAKPRALGGGGSRFGTELLAKVRALGGPHTTQPSPSRFAQLSDAASGAVSTRRLEPFTALALGSSTGGPTALSALLSALPETLPVPIFITQHMPPIFTRIFAEWLTATSGFPVVEATDGEVVRSGRAYVAPGDYHMTFEREARVVTIALNRNPRENSCRPAVDVMFRSLASVYGKGVLAAVLTGMGHDGTRGAQALAAVGAQIIVQDARSCLVPSMPKSVATAVAVDGTFPIDSIGTELLSRLMRNRAGSRYPLADFPAPDEIHTSPPTRRAKTG